MSIVHVEYNDAVRYFTPFVEYLFENEKIVVSPGEDVIVFHGTRGENPEYNTIEIRRVSRKLKDGDGKETGWSPTGSEPLATFQWLQFPWCCGVVMAFNFHVEGLVRLLDGAAADHEDVWKEFGDCMHKFFSNRDYTVCHAWVSLGERMWQEQFLYNCGFKPRGDGVVSRSTENMLVQFELPLYTNDDDQEYMEESWEDNSYRYEDYNWWWTEDKDYLEHDEW